MHHLAASITLSNAACQPRIYVYAFSLLHQIAGERCLQGLRMGVLPDCDNLTLSILLVRCTNSNDRLQKTAGALSEKSVDGLDLAVLSDIPGEFAAKKHPEIFFNKGVDFDFLPMYKSNHC